LTQIGDIAGVHRRKSSAASASAAKARRIVDQIDDRSFAGCRWRIEAVFTALALRDRVAPPTANLFNRDPKCDLDFVPNAARKMKICEKRCPTVRLRRDGRDAGLPRDLTPTRPWH
jgi:hypothetical protein